LPLHNLKGESTTLPILLADLKAELLNQKAAIMALQEQMKSLGAQETASAQERGNTAALGNLENYKDGPGRIDFTRYSTELRETMYQTRQLTMATRGYVMLARSAGILKSEDQIKAYQNLTRLIRMAYQAQRAVEQLDRLSSISMASNPVGWAMAAISAGGRLSSSISYSSRMSGGSGI